MRYLMLVLVLAACAKNPSAPPSDAVLHIGNGSPESVSVSYRVSGTWTTLGDVDASQCFAVPDNATAVRAVGKSSRTIITDAVALATSRDWIWDFNTATGFSYIGATTTVCIAS